MKPFNLEQAKAGRPLVTRDGRSARFIAHVPEAAPLYRVLCLVAKEASVFTFTETGKAFPDTDTSHDLFMVSSKRTWWIAVWPQGVGSFRLASYFYESEEMARTSLTCTSEAVVIPVELED